MIALLPCTPSPPAPREIRKGNLSGAFAAKAFARMQNVGSLQPCLGVVWKEEEQPAELNANSRGCTSGVDTGVLHTQQQLSASCCRVHYHPTRNKDGYKALYALCAAARLKWEVSQYGKCILFIHRFHLLI